MSTRNIFISAIFASFLLITNCQAQPSHREHFPPVRPISSDVKIQVALLLDCSNSMDGLIDQAKSRLWNIVNTLTTLKYQGKEPVIEISLYQYGNDNLSSEYVFIVDRELRLRGRKDDEDTDGGRLYGYNMNSVNDLKNKMKKDIEIIYYQLKKSLEKEKRRKRKI